MLGGFDVKPVGLVPVFEGPVRDCLDVRDAGNAGGPIDVLFPLILGRGFVIVIEGCLELVDGVVVLGVDELEPVPDVSCLVGDFVGDY